MRENVRHKSKSPIKMYRNQTFCDHVHNLHPGANLHHLESWSKFAPFAPGCKFLKHRSHGQKYTRGANMETRVLPPPPPYRSRLHPSSLTTYCTTLCHAKALAKVLSHKGAISKPQLYLIGFETNNIHSRVGCRWG